MPTKRGSHIDFEPANVSSIIVDGDILTISLLSQPCFSEKIENDPSRVPNYECQLRIRDGSVELMTGELPIRADSISVKYAAGSRYCFLPKDFEESGPVLVTFEVAEKPVIVVSGSHIALNANRTTSETVASEDDT